VALTALPAADTPAASDNRVSASHTLTISGGM